MASSSWCKETDAKINYTKLCRLLVDGGTQAVRSVFDGIHPPSSLKAILNANKTKLQRLKKPKGMKVLNDKQWDKLYPPNGSDPTSEDFDITLLFVLLRNICGLTPPATGWDVLPPVADTSLEANLARIKHHRNNTIAHNPNTEINDVDFAKHWQDISSALVSLGMSQDDINDLKSAPLGEEDYNKLLYDWYKSDKDIKTQLEEVQTDTADIKSDTADLKSDTADLKSDTADLESDTADLKSDTAGIKSDTADLKSDTADLKSDTAEMKDKLDDIRNVCIDTQKRDKAIEKLHFSNFGLEINRKCKSYHPNTRQWILDQVKSHLDSDQPDSCIMLITAGPGMGKSTIAAKICQIYKDLGRLAGCHFFQFSNSTRNNPRLMLQSIARQMCDTVPGYQEALEGKLRTNLGKNIDDMSCEELLTILLEEPLCNVERTDSNMVVVLDALDECSHNPKDELLKALRNKLSCFPSWLRFIVTSRPSTNTSALESMVAVEIRAEDHSNTKDLILFFNCKLKDLYPQHDFAKERFPIKKLVEMTKGLFLVAFFVIDLLERQNLESPEKVLELFPNGISSVYENYFCRLKEVLSPYIAEEEAFFKMLEAVVATNYPLPKKMFYDILCVKSENDVRRQDRKKRKDALNSLHWLFPVEGDHVVPFHKSVFDWLTLEGDEEHDFSVRVEDGNEVLASQCNEALSDIRDGEKDMDKPLNLTDSEIYALRFLCHLVHKDSSVVKADKYRFFSNIYVLTALRITHKELLHFDENISKVIKSSSLREAFRLTSRCLSKRLGHEPSCRFSHPISFGSKIEFFLQAAHAQGVSEEATPIPLDGLKKHGFPYCHRLNTLLQISREESLRYVLECKVGIILSIYCSNSLSTAVQLFQRDGSLISKKSFPGKRLLATSPNINFIVAAEREGNKIEILDVTTLEVVSQYQSPHDAIETCHVFENNQKCFIVIKGCYDNKIYVMEGLTGQVRITITVKQGSTVKDVSRQGHIVVKRTCRKREEPEEITFTNKDGEVKLKVNWKSGDKYPHTYREMFLCHSDGREPIPIHQLADRICSCPVIILSLSFDMGKENHHFSEDGRLLAYHYTDSIFIVNTTDGSLYKHCSFNLGFWNSDIFFVSGSYLVISKTSFMYVVNVQADEIEHSVYLHYLDYPNIKHYLLLLEEDGKSFNLISSLSKDDVYEVSRLVFHNLNLRGLR